MKTLKPTTDRVVVLPVQVEEQLAGLMIVRDNKNIEMQHGRVIAAGPLSDIKEGEEVLFNPAAGTLLRRLKDDGEWENLRIMHADTIQAVIK